MGGTRRTFLFVVVLVSIAAAPPRFRPTPRFEGKAIPDPPHQAAAWTPPETKLPRFLIEATAALYECGMADPRGCAYREVDLGKANLITTHAFVLPEPPGRFAVAWDGIVYPVASVGPEADLDADIRRLSETLQAPPPDAERAPFATASASRFVGAGRLGAQLFGEGGPATEQQASALKLCLLLRLGRADLAEALFSAATLWTPDASSPDLTDYRINFLSLASERAGILYDRLLSAHQRGDDAVALDAARRLDGFRRAVDARAEAMGFPRTTTLSGNSAGVNPAPYLHGFDALSALLADQERRAQEPPRAPIPPRGGDPSARIAALIRDFDQIDAAQFSVPDSGDQVDAPVVREVIAEGDPAVEPLLAALVSDTRLTRSVSGGRGLVAILGVTDSIIGALRGILKTELFSGRGTGSTDPYTLAGRRDLASAIRSFWQKNRGVALTERWYRTLRDDTAGLDRWLEAAAGLVQPAAPNVRPDSARPEKTPALTGEPLRNGRDPSVTDLLARRCAEVLRSAEPLRVCSLATAFARWDPASAVPTLRSLTDALRDRSLDVNAAHQQDVGYGRQMAALTLLRASAGDRNAIDDYAAWVQAVPPEAIQHSLRDSLKPMWDYPRHPAIAASARAMFLNPNSAWLPLVPTKPGRTFPPFEDPIASPLVCVLEFRAALLDALADKTPAGTAKCLKQGGVSYRMASGLSGGENDGLDPDRDETPGVEVAVRACDVVASRLAALEGAPECRLPWPEARRDAAVAACAAYLRRFGRNLSPEPLPGLPDFPHPRAHLRFPVLDRPATAADVEAAWAIFSLEGEGETRIVTLPAGFPARARWTTLEKFPITRQFGDGTSAHDYLRDGFVWQAEEVRKGGRWERYYGFVGHATIARAPASEIEFPSEPWADLPLSGGFNAQLSPGDTPSPGRAPGRPTVVRMRLRNRLGIGRLAPTEFVGRADDGKPSLRRGLRLEMSSHPADAGQGSLGVPQTPTRTARFEPAGASRLLAPTESFEALSLDVNDWFGPLRPGRYTFRITFAADSGLGEGRTNDVPFTVGEADPPR